MPKQKTTTKKQPGRLGNALKWLKPTTPAKGMLLFVIVFAIAGGSYYAYKSFANSWTTYPKDFINLTNTAISTDCNSTKKCIPVAKMGGSASSMTGRIYTNFAEPTVVAVCVTLRVRVQSPSLGYANINISTSNAATTWTMYQTTTYTDKCVFTKTNAGPYFLDTILTTGGYASSPDVYVAGITMKW